MLTNLFGERKEVYYVTQLIIGGAINLILLSGFRSLSHLRKISKEKSKVLREIKCWR
jgi:hypothetical protein